MFVNIDRHLEKLRARVYSSGTFFTGSCTTLHYIAPLRKEDIMHLFRSAKPSNDPREAG